MLNIAKDPSRRGGFLLEADWLVNRPLEEVFAYFSNAMNLEELTPPLLRFQVLTPQPIVMRQGLLIDYKLYLHGLPMRWRSEITAWEPGRRFVDEQRRGPYRYWRHEHLFEETPDGVRVLDRVHYGVPLGWLLHGTFVRPDLEKIFGYRHQVLSKVFPPMGAVSG